MTIDDRLDKLAHELARRLPEDAGDSGLSDARLRAYLEGAGDENIERLLATDARARARLLQVAGLAEPVTPARVRSRVLQKPISAVPIWTRQLAAALALLAVGLVAWFGTTSSGSTRAQRAEFATLNYAVSLEALANVRSADAVASESTAFADSTVTIAVTPDISTSLPVRIGLFAGAASGLQKIEPLSVDTVRGALTIRFRPDQIKSLTAGRWPIVVVIGLNEVPSLATVTNQPRDTTAWKFFDHTLTVVERSP